MISNTQISKSINTNYTSNRKLTSPETKSLKTDEKTKSENKKKNQFQKRKTGIQTTRNYIKGVLEDLETPLKKADLMVNQLRWSSKCLINAMGIYSSFLRYKIYFKLLEAVILNEEKNKNFFERFRIIDQILLNKVEYDKVNWRYVKNLHHHYRIKVIRKYEGLHNELLIKHQRKREDTDMDIFVEMNEVEEEEFNFKILEFVSFFLYFFFFVRKGKF